jgi:hypothetical protein
LPGRRASRDSRSIDSLSDTARFRPDDPDTLVSASLVCPLCLRGDDIDWHASLEGYDPSVRCRCPSCQEWWSVYLTPEQALRLGLMHAHAG